MNIDVRFHGLRGSRPLRRHIARRVLVHLSRFRRELTRVLVRIADVNGPKGGLDKRCLVHVRGPRLGSTIIEEHGSDAYAAIDAAASRTGRALSRHLHRRHTREKTRSKSERRHAWPSNR